MRFWRLLCLLFAAASLAGPATAQKFPKFTGLVVDQANILPPDVEARLTSKLEALQKDTNRQVVVVTIADLQDHPIGDYTLALGRAWGVGLKDANNGVILSLAPNAGQGLRGPDIEVGYGLEPVLTDTLSAIVIRDEMMPRLKAGQVPEAVEAGADAIIAQLRASPEEAQAKVQASVVTFDKAQDTHPNSDSGIPLGLVFWVFVIGFVALSFLRRRRGRGERYRGDGGDSGILPVVLWSIANEIGNSAMRGGGGSSLGGGGGSSGGGGWGGGGFTGGGGGSFGGGGASGSW